MLSICIPVYNYDVSPLVEELHRQLAASGISFEILLIDDASSSGFREKNRQIALSNTVYLQLERNIGWTKIRNLLAQKARYPYLLCMDSDSEIPSDTYVARYIDICRPGIVCFGGRMYEKQMKNRNLSLRWKYGKERESHTAVHRRKHPNVSFQAGNFIIDKNLFNIVSFNEALTEYGNEDTLFGLELLEHHILIEHIDNPLIHLGLEENTRFLKKVESSLINLKQIERILENRHIDRANFPRIVRTKKLLERYCLKGVVTFLFGIFRSVMTRNLCGKNPNLFLFDLYRVGFFCSID
jgi:glycosyltransferase involved in cell wall biosynthesis